jgi:hypothetical protein
MTGKPRLHRQMIRTHDGNRCVFNAVACASRVRAQQHALLVVNGHTLKQTGRQSTTRVKRGRAVVEAAVYHREQVMLGRECALACARLREADALLSSSAFPPATLAEAKASANAPRKTICITLGC